jgi:hypothetical protein
MTKKYIILIILCLITIEQLFGQDTTIYTQENAVLFGNSYKFIKKNKSSSSGFFIQSSSTDDGQLWYGQGKFTETKEKIFLTFDTTDNFNRIETTYSTKHIDTLYIKWFDWKGYQETWFSMKFADTTQNNKIYRADLLEGFVKIPKQDLIGKQLLLYDTFDSKIFSFLLPENVNEIKIFANNLARTHSFNKKKEVLKKNKKGFITIGMWTEEKPTQFIIWRK